jgi:hypothetical protein
MDSPTGFGGDLTQEMACTSYFQGVLDVGVNLGALCGHFKVATAERVYVAYMQANPKLMDEPKFTGAWRALQNSYPCESK